MDVNREDKDSCLERTDFSDLWKPMKTGNKAKVTNRQDLIKYKCAFLFVYCDS